MSVAVRTILSSILISVVAHVVWAEKTIVGFKCDGLSEEQLYLNEDYHSHVYQRNPSAGAFRVTNGKTYLVYRFELPGIQHAKMILRLGNSYKISLSNDGKTYKTVLQVNEVVGGLGNLGTRSIDLDPFLGNGSPIYMRSEHFDPTAGYGGCLLSVTIQSDDDLDFSLLSSQYSEGQTGSFSFDHGLLSQNPPLFKPTESPIEHYEADIKFFKGDSYVPGATPVVEGVYLDGRGADSKLLSETPLVPGEYTVLVNWKDKGESLYAQQVGVTLVDEDRQALVANLAQPFFSSEESITVEYEKRNPVAEMCRWRVLAENGEEIAQSKVSLEGESGDVFVPLSSVASNGNYILTLEPASQTDGDILFKFPFEKGSALGVPTKYSVGESGKWLKNGKDFLPVIMFLPRDFEELAKAGFTTVISGRDSDAFDLDDLKYNIKMLDDAATHHLTVWLHVPNLFRHNEDFSGLRNMVARLKTHPALGGWYTADEPDAAGIRPHTLKEAKEIIHKLDPNHPVIGLSNLPDMFKPFANCFDTFMCDPYPIPGRNVGMVMEWIERCQESVGSDGSFAVALQAQGKPYYPRAPTPEESWNMAYQAVVGGCKGIGWWAHGPAREKWDVYEKLVPEVRKIMGMTAFSKSNRKFEEKGVYSAVFETTSGTVVVCVNTTKEAQQIVVPVKIAGSIVRLDSGRSAELHQGENELKLVVSQLGCGAWIVK